MRKARWLAGWKGSHSKPVIYHCISRVVDRRFVFGARECEAFRMHMRMYENFSGCRVLSYCMMSNHFHLLLEVPPMAEAGLSDEELLHRLSGLYSEAFVAGVAAKLAEARKSARTTEIESGASCDAGDTGDNEARVAEIHSHNFMTDKQSNNLLALGFGFGRMDSCAKLDGWLVGRVRIQSR